MGYDRSDSFPFDFEPNGIPFGSENRIESYHHDHIPFNVKGKRNIVFSCIDPTLAVAAFAIWMILKPIMMNNDPILTNY